MDGRNGMVMKKRMYGMGDDRKLDGRNGVVIERWTD